MTVDYTALVKAAMKNDEQAISRLFEDTYKESYFIARQTIRDGTEAEDIVQDAYIKAFQSLHMLKDYEKFKPWLHKIVVNKCKDYLKKKKPDLFTDLLVLQHDQEEQDFEATLKNETKEYQPDDMLDKKAMVEIFNGIFEELSPEQRLCIILFYREQRSVSEIADMLQISEGTVKSRLNYGRKKVKERVEEYEREGLKLYSGMPILLWALRNNGGETITIPTDMLSKIVSSTGIAGASASAGSGTSSTAAGSFAGKTVAANVAVGLKTKIIAGIVAASIAVGGGGMALKTINHQNEQKQAEKAYTELLAGIPGEGDLERNYYAYLDLNQDDIPELLISDEIRPIWTDYELYRFMDGEAVKCDYGSNYAGRFYLVNEDSLFTSSRGYGDSYLNLTKQGIHKEVYNKTWRNHFGEQEYGDDVEWFYYNYSGEAVDYEALELTKITENDYVYYCNTEEGVITGEGFVESMEPITFLKNEQRAQLPDVEATPEELTSMLEIAYWFGNTEIVDGNDYIRATAEYGDGMGYGLEKTMFLPEERRLIVEGNEFVVYDLKTVNSFFIEIVGVNKFVQLPEFTGYVDWSSLEPYVYQKDGKLYVVYDGLGGPIDNPAELIDYIENGDGTATAKFRRENYYDISDCPAEYLSELTVQRNRSGGLQIKEYEEEK